MQKYCLGFIFSEDFSDILLVKKIHTPKNAKFLLNKLNGIGGHVENDESSLEAMGRECYEETGIRNCKFIEFASLRAKFGYVDCYYTVTNDIYFYVKKEDEPLKIYSVNPFNGARDYNWYQDFNPVANLLYLIPMALNHIQKKDLTDVFIITETYK